MSTSAYWHDFKYYEGHLYIRVSRSKYENRWFVLLGNEIHLYATKIPQRDQGVTKPIQHYPLHSSTAITLDNDFKMHIKCELWTIRAQATSNEERENWRIRILTIAKGVPPDQERLLPGQQELLQDILQKESARRCNQGRPVKGRRSSVPGVLQHTPPHANLPSRGRSFKEQSHGYADNTYYKFLPEDIACSQLLPPIWFFGKVSRLKAEEVLHQSTSNGDLLLRESEAHPGQFTLSVRQDTDSKSLIRHYMFKKDPYSRGFLLLIEDKPPVLGSMYELMWFFIQESGGHLLPIQKDPKLPAPNYDTRVPVTNPVNGEMSLALKRELTMHKSHSTGDASSTNADEDDYLVPDVLLSPTAASSSLRSRSTSVRSSLPSTSESFEEEDHDTYSPGNRDDALPPREPPNPPPAGDNTSTGYVRMRSFSSTPSFPSQSALSQGDVGYINMKKQSSLDETSSSSSSSAGAKASNGGNNGDAPLRSSNSCPPEASFHSSNVGELHKAFKRFGLTEESSA